MKKSISLIALVLLVISLMVFGCPPPRPLAEKEPVVQLPPVEEPKPAEEKPVIEEPAEEPKPAEEEFPTHAEQWADPVQFGFERGDKTPEHLVEVLGSWERYERLKKSYLILSDTMHIVYDMRMCADRIKLYFVGMLMRGEVVKIQEKVITIARDNMTASFLVSKGATIRVGMNEIEFKDLKVGDWLSHVYIVMNDLTYPLGQVRSIHIVR